MATVADVAARFHELLAACEPAALEYLYQYAPRLELALRRKFGAIIAPEDIKDIVRDGLIRALRTGDRFDPDVATITTWLNTLVHYEALEFLRRNLALCRLNVSSRAKSNSRTSTSRRTSNPAPRLNTSCSAFRNNVQLFSGCITMKAGRTKRSRACLKSPRRPLSRI